MPELPEVEIVTRHLNSLLVGRQFLKSQLIRPALAAENSPRQFSLWLKNTIVESVTRRGKHILLHFDNQRTLIIHLRMTGRFHYLENTAENPKHTHALFALDQNKKLAFTDQRHFAMMHLLRTSEVTDSKYISKLAPEPFSEEFTDKYLQTILKRSKQPIKLTLLDQTKVLGLGNIYASEALFLSGIHPRLSSSLLSLPRTKILRKMILHVLNEAILNNSTMNMNPAELDGSYAGGVYESMTKAYEREGKPCYKCETPIERFTQGGRSTYFCSKCQKR